jgi:hypothetical protein
MNKTDLYMTSVLLVATPFFAGWVLARSSLGYDVKYESILLFFMTLVFTMTVSLYKED